MKNKLSSIIFFAALAGISMSSCVSKKKYLDARANADQLRADSVRLASKLATQNDNFSNLQKSNARLQQQISLLQKQMDSANGTAEGEFAEFKRSLENLQALVEQRYTTSDLRDKTTNALPGFHSNGLGVAIKNGKVYVSLQENMLFPPGSAVVNTKSNQTLGKLAGILPINPAIKMILKAIPRFRSVSKTGD